MIGGIDIRALVPLITRIALAVAALLVLAWFLMSWYEARHIRIDRHTIHDARIPASLDGTTLAFAADIHAGPIFGALRVRRLVEKINAEEPDLVVLGGDYVGGRSQGATAFYPEIAALDASKGVYAVLGNHDVWEGVDDARTGFKAAQIELLENGIARIQAEDGSIAIVGLEDEWTGVPDSEALLGGLKPDEFGVLVAHNPDSFENALADPEAPWGLGLAGHTHGGQVSGVYHFLPHKPTAFGRRFLGGWTDESGTPVLVSNGVGTVTLPLRFLAPPQIHVITLSRTGA